MADPTMAEPLPDPELDGWRKIAHQPEDHRIDLRIARSSLATLIGEIDRLRARQERLTTALSASMKELRDEAAARESVHGIMWCSVHCGVADELDNRPRTECDLATDLEPCTLHELFYTTPREATEQGTATRGQPAWIDASNQIANIIGTLARNEGSFARLSVRYGAADVALDVLRADLNHEASHG